MTIKELIKLLLEYPIDTEVFTCGEETDGNKLGYKLYIPSPKMDRFLIKNNRYYTAQRACEETKNAKKCIVL